jgi:hypothetical protein
MRPSDDSARPDRGESTPPKPQLGAAKFESVNAPAAGTPPPVDVHALLHDNLAREKAAGLHDLAPLPPRRSRRRRDYWLALVAGNLAIVALMVVFGPGLIQLVSGGAGIVIYSCGLTWMMWVVIDDY